MKFIYSIMVALGICSTNLYACSWASLSEYYFEEHYLSSEYVFLGKVIEAPTVLNGTVEVIESFKGTKDKKIFVLKSDDPYCGNMTFQMGDEAIFFITSHYRSDRSATKDKRLIRRLRQLRIESEVAE